MNFDNLNKMVEYIENNINSEINFDQLSKITNINTHIIREQGLEKWSLVITPWTN